MALRPDRDGVVRIGNPRGKIALYLDEREAVDMACRYGRGDEAFGELMDAVAAAYPEPTDDEPRLGIAITVSR